MEAELDMKSPRAQSVPLQKETILLGSKNLLQLSLC